MCQPCHRSPPEALGQQSKPVERTDQGVQNINQWVVPASTARGAAHQGACGGGEAHEGEAALLDEVGEQVDLAPPQAAVLLHHLRAQTPLSGCTAGVEPRAPPPSFPRPHVKLFTKLGIYTFNNKYHDNIMNVSIITEYH